MTNTASSSESSEASPKGANAAQSRRFTPLRSYMTRAQALSREARGELGLSRLVPVARLHG